MRSVKTTWIVTVLLSQTFLVPGESIAACTGRIFNPITDVDWMGVFPIKIGGVTVAGFGQEDTDTVNISPICFCADRPPPLNAVPGIPVSFWEPIRLLEVVRDPYCFPSLGGVDLSETISGYGTNQSPDAGQAFYHVHDYVYPLFALLELVTDFACLEQTGFDLAYMTELDPFWNNPELGLLLNPEATLFANPISITACTGDCAAATAGFPLDPLFWCAGCWGQLYPFTGYTGRAGAGPNQASALIATRFIAKMHREGLLFGSVGAEGLCGNYPMPIIKKSQYKLQLAYPRAGKVFPVGRSQLVWGWGVTYPVAGEDFVYVLWRKRDCCVL